MNSPRDREEEAEFHQILEALPRFTEKHLLFEAVKTALRLLLRRPEDQALLVPLVNELGRQIEEIHPESYDQQVAQVRRAAIACVRILKKAKRQRAPRAAAPIPDKSGQWGWGAAVALAGSAVVGLFLLSIGLLSLPIGSGPPLTGLSLASKMEEAARSGAPVTVGGHKIKVRVAGDSLTVSTDGLGPEVCVEAATKLAQKGQVSINGSTMWDSAAKKVETRCHQYPEEWSLSYSIILRQ